MLSESKKRKDVYDRRDGAPHVSRNMEVNTVAVQRDVQHPKVVINTHRYSSSDDERQVARTVRSPLMTGNHFRTYGDAHPENARETNVELRREGGEGGFGRREGGGGGGRGGE